MSGKMVGFWVLVFVVGLVALLLLRLVLRRHNHTKYTTLINLESDKMREKARKYAGPAKYGRRSLTFVMLSTGTRGDVQPFIALGR